MAGCIGVLLALRLLIPAGGDPSVFAAFGEEATPTLDYARSRLGDVATRPLQGHDGKFFFVQANDPFLLEPESNAVVLDRPTYRSQRALYPILASLGGLLAPTAVLWGLLVTNLIAFSLGSAALAKYAAHVGMSPWFGLAFTLNPGLISELAIDGAGVVAFALVVGGMLSLVRGRDLTAFVLLAAACLTREAMLVSVAGLSAWLWCDGRRARAVRLTVVSVSAVLAWGVYVRLRLPPATNLTEVQEIGLPFLGLIGAFQRWLDDLLFLATGSAIVVCLALFTSQVARGRRDALAWASVGFVGLATLLTTQVWAASFDMTRAVAPVLTALIVSPLLFGPRRRPLVEPDA